MTPNTLVFNAMITPIYENPVKRKLHTFFIS